MSEKENEPGNISDKTEQPKPAKTKKGPCVFKGSGGDQFIETECESLPSSCTETSTSTGNLIDRMIQDPSRLREPSLRQWPVIYPKYDEVGPDNPHQQKASQKTMQLNHMCFLRVDSVPNAFRQPAIIGTLGPSCTTVDAVLELLEAGMNVARINMAHVDPCNIISGIQNIVEATNRHSATIDYSLPIGIMMDLKGPEIRTGTLDTRYLKNSSAEVRLNKGCIVRLTSDTAFKNHCSEKFIFVDYEPLPVQIQPEMEIYISTDIKLRVEAIDGLHIVCNVQTEGILKNYQQVHVPMLPVALPPLSDFDWECLDIAAEQEVDIIVVPKTRNEKIIHTVKDVLDKKEAQPHILIFAKISNYEGLRNIDRIISAADGIVIHKNDLALELPPAKMFLAQKEIIAKCNKAGKPVVCSVQLKSELSDLAQSIMDGADCLMLTEETAKGGEGANSVRTLCEIIREAEAATMHSLIFSDLINMLTPSIEPSVAIALAAVDVADKIRAAAILTVTTSGKTAQLLSWFRPKCPVLAITRTGRVGRQLNMWRSVIPLIFRGPLENDWFEDCSSRIRHGITYGKDRGIIKPGDPLVLVTGYRKNAGFTNCLRVVFAALNQRSFVDNAKKFFAIAK